MWKPLSKELLLYLFLNFLSLPLSGKQNETLYLHWRFQVGDCTLTQLRWSAESSMLSSRIHSADLERELKERESKGELTASSQLESVEVEREKRELKELELKRIEMQTRTWSAYSTNFSSHIRLLWLSFAYWQAGKPLEARKLQWLSTARLVYRICSRSLFVNHKDRYTDGYKSALTARGVTETVREALR